MARATGQPLSTEPYIAYLHAKYGELYSCRVASKPVDFSGCVQQLSPRCAPAFSHCLRSRSRQSITASWRIGEEALVAFAGLYVPFLVWIRSMQVRMERRRLVYRVLAREYSIDYAGKSTR